MNSIFIENFLTSARFEFKRYKIYGDQTFVQLTEDDLNWQSSKDQNSIAVIVKHLNGNMLSRWTNFLLEDGEKQWRHRDNEFLHKKISKEKVLNLWNEGWNCLFKALDTVSDSNFDTTIKIRNESHTLIEAVHRQLAHYASHVGQIVYIGKTIKGTAWKSISIPKGKSTHFNQKMFGKNS